MLIDHFPSATNSIAPAHNGRALLRREFDPPVAPIAASGQSAVGVQSHLGPVGLQEIDRDRLRPKREYDHGQCSSHPHPAFANGVVG